MSSLSQIWMLHLKLRDQQQQASHTVYGGKDILVIFLANWLWQKYLFVLLFDLVGYENRCATVVSPITSHFSHLPLSSTRHTMLPDTSKYHSNHQSQLRVIHVTRDLKIWRMHLQWIPGSLFYPCTPHTIIREPGERCYGLACHHKLS